ncbi:hypothetical protein FRC12_022021 [Ceratobasidium sp. 428]|nr:hypothetical protein FRC12_022021 [Ceratobasidium sp. 428]
MQVVERSACLALLYNSPTNIASSFSYLLDTYPTSLTKQSDSTPNKHVISFLYFLHTLLDEYPSQRASHRLLLPTASNSTSLHLPPNSPEHTIASSISSALRRHNWYTLHTLTSPQFIHNRLTWSIPKSDQDRNPSAEDEVFEALPQRALFHLLRELRAKVRSSAWPVLRSAYREVVDGPWLERSLMFGREKDSSSAGATISELTEFMRLGVEKDEAGVKDSSGARVWILRRPS